MQNRDSYNRGGFIAFIFSMAFSLIFMAYIGLFHPGIDLREVPAEAMGAAGLAGAAPAAIDMSQVAKPWLENEGVAAHGKKVYQTNCAACHGNTGAGDGPAGGALNPPPRNLIEGKWKQGGDSVALYKTLTNGIPGTSMAQFAHLPASDRWALVQFIRSITKDKPADDAGALDSFAQTAK